MFHNGLKTPWMYFWCLNLTGMRSVWMFTMPPKSPHKRRIKKIAKKEEARESWDLSAVNWRIEKKKTKESWRQSEAACGKTTFYFPPVNCVISTASSHAEGQDQRLFNYVDDNSLINHRVKSTQFCTPVNVVNSLQNFWAEKCNWFWHWFFLCILILIKLNKKAL